MTPIVATRSKTPRGEGGDYLPLFSKEWYANKAVELSQRERKTPGGFKGRGVVTVGGGEYFPGTYVLVRMLRTFGFNYPIWCWHIGPDEMTKKQRRILEEEDVVVKDVLPHMEKFKDWKFAGWVAKLFAIAHSPFRHVLFIDSDNTPVKNPAHLFDSEEYKETGALFWPDNAQYPKAKIWDILPLERKDICLEAGQLLIDKERCWKEFQLAWWMNRHSRFWYNLMYGDKDTFNIAWRLCGSEWGGPVKRGRYENVMIQFDLDGSVLFQHRCGHKLGTFGENRFLGSLKNEKFIHSLVKELEEKLSRPFKPPRQNGRPKRLLVCGIPRSGTTWLGHVINAFPGVSCGHEFNLYGIVGPSCWERPRMRPPDRDWTRNTLAKMQKRLKQADSLGPNSPPGPSMCSEVRSFLGSAPTGQGIVNQSRPSRGCILEHLENRIWKGKYEIIGDKYPVYAPLTDELTDLIDIDFLIVCVRDLYDVAASHFIGCRKDSSTYSKALKRVTRMGERMLFALDGVEQPIYFADYSEWKDSPFEIVEDLSELFKCESVGAKELVEKRVKFSSHPQVVSKGKHSAEPSLIDKIDSLNRKLRSLSHE